jgi:hypothetical protein
MDMFGATSDIFLKFLKTLAKEAAEIHDIPYSTIGKREFQQLYKSITLKFSNNHNIKLLTLLV